MSNAIKAASLLARAATDPDLLARLKQDPAGTAKAEGVELHQHEGYVVLEDGPGLRHIVVTDATHGTASSGELPAEPTVGDVRRWATYHVHAGDATGDAVRKDVNAAIAAAGAQAPDGLSFEVAVDDAKVMHMVVPFAGAAAVGLAEADAFAGAGTESVVTDTTAVQTAEVETTEAAQVETTVEVGAEVAVAAVEVETTFSSTTVVAEVEVAIVPGFIT